MDRNWDKQNKQNFIDTERMKLDLERRMLKEQSALFDQKLEILKEAYIQLDKDKRKVEWEKLKLKAEQEHQERSYGRYDDTGMRQETDASVFFKGVTNQLALKKRYRDLIKIFHTDNLYGDKETLQAINREYDRLQKRYDAPWRQNSG
ncbi:MAG: hypothetical protein HDQ98_08485 [Lachnospiraceae bacterium]|nr:hypothetical protein [Lachnospiraceae bacterium]